MLSLCFFRPCLVLVNQFKLADHAPSPGQNWPISCEVLTLTLTLARIGLSRVEVLTLTLTLARIGLSRVEVSRYGGSLVIHAGGSQVLGLGLGLGSLFMLVAARC